MSASPLRLRLSVRHEFEKSYVEPQTWVTRRWSTRRVAALLFYWAVVCVAFPILYVAAGMLYGALQGFGHGFVRGASEAHAEATKYWKSFEGCE